MGVCLDSFRVTSRLPENQLLSTSTECSPYRDVGSSPGGPTPSGRGVEASLLAAEGFLLFFPTHPGPKALTLTGTRMQLVQTAVPDHPSILVPMREAKSAQARQIWDYLKDLGSHSITCHHIGSKPYT